VSGVGVRVAEEVGKGDGGEGVVVGEGGAVDLHHWDWIVKANYCRKRDKMNRLGGIVWRGWWLCTSLEFVGVVCIEASCGDRVSVGWMEFSLGPGFGRRMGFGEKSSDLPMFIQCHCDCHCRLSIQRNIAS
jgi:hypothetical protein